MPGIRASSCIPSVLKLDSTFFGKTRTASPYPKYACPKPAEEWGHDLEGKDLGSNPTSDT